jgi:hypothetical protein
VIDVIKNDEFIILNYKWGSCNTRRGGNKNLIVKNLDEVNFYVNAMIKRRKSRGYDLISAFTKNNS